MKQNTSPNMLKKQDQTEAEFTKLLRTVCSRGFFGTASVTINLQDGQIQHTRVMVDRMIR